jgi:guanylate kinase
LKVNTDKRYKGWGKGKIFVISAPSGSGKTTLCQQLLHLDPKGLLRSISVTTRPPRKGEREAKDYFFVTREEFESRKKRAFFLEWAEVLGNFYGTPREFVESWIRKGKDVILSIDVQGAMQLKKKCPTAVLIFILPPSFKNLKSRLKKRSTETNKEILKRLNLARREISYLPKYDYVVVNDTIKRATEELRAIIIAERCRIK